MQPLRTLTPTTPARRGRKRPPKPHNENTRFPHRGALVDAWPSATLSADHRASWERAAPLDVPPFASLAALRAQQLDTQAVGFVVRAPDAWGNLCYTSSLHFFEEGQREPHAWVLGRHTECDGPIIAGASLRHALLFSFPSDDGGPPSLEVLDLATEVGIGTPQGVAVRALQSVEGLRFSVGTADVFFFSAARGEPLFPVDAAQRLGALAKAPLPTHEVHPSAAAGASAEAALAFFAGVRDVDNHRQRAQFGTESPTQRRGVTENSQVIFSFDQVSESPLCAWRAHPERVTPVVVLSSWDELEQGLLLGRATRCRAAEDLAHSEDISRVHACLWVRRGQVFVVDTGSTNGTEVRSPCGSVQLLSAARRVCPIGPVDELYLHHTRVVVQLGPEPLAAEVADVA